MRWVAIAALIGLSTRLVNPGTACCSITMLSEDEQARQGYDFLCQASFGLEGPGPDPSDRAGPTETPTT